MENRVERCTPTGVQAPRGIPCVSFIYRTVERKNERKRSNAGLINDILNIRRGRRRKFSGLLQRAVSCGACHIEEISQSRVHRRANKFADEMRDKAI